MEKQSYLIAELALLTLGLLLKPEHIRWASFLERRFLATAAGLYFFWLALDLAAVRLGLWFFPIEGTLPWRLLGLPLEEHGIFLIHTILCYVLLGLVRR